MTDRYVCPQKEDTGTRLRYIDIAKLLAICAVMLDHAQYYIPGIQQDAGFSIFRIILFGFFLQTFFITIGIVDRYHHFNKTSDTWKKYFQKLFTSIIVPYILWGIILGSKHDLEFIRGMIWGTQTSLAEAGTDGLLWFFPVLFLTKVMYQIISQIQSHMSPKAGQVALIVFAVVLAYCGFEAGRFSANRIIWGFDIALMCTSLALQGKIIKPLIEWVRQLSNPIKLLCLAVCASVAIISCYANMPFIFDENGLVIYRESVWMARGYFGRSCGLFIVSSLFSCVSVLIIGMILEKWRLLAQMGQYTLGLMVTHGKMYPFAAMAISKLTGEHNMNAIILSILAMVLVTILCMPVVLFLERFVPELLGKTAKN